MASEVDHTGQKQAPKGKKFRESQCEDVSCDCRKDWPHGYYGKEYIVYDNETQEKSVRCESALRDQEFYIKCNFCKRWMTNDTQYSLDHDYQVCYACYEKARAIPVIHKFLKTPCDVHKWTPDLAVPANYPVVDCEKCHAKHATYPFGVSETTSFARLIPDLRMKIEMIIQKHQDKLCVRKFTDCFYLVCNENLEKRRTKKQERRDKEVQATAEREIACDNARKRLIHTIFPQSKTMSPEMFSRIPYKFARVSTYQQIAIIEELTNSLYITGSRHEEIITYTKMLAQL